MLFYLPEPLLLLLALAVIVLLAVSRTARIVAIVVVVLVVLIGCHKDREMSASEEIPTYNRDAFAHWSDLDSDGCDTRQEVLATESLYPTTCDALAGEWYSIYDGVRVTNPSDLDIDHIVPLSNAWTSGAWEWTDSERERFANDRANLIAVTASSNRSKGDRTPGEWMAPPEHRCWYAATWVSVKSKYNLTITDRERRAIDLHCPAGFDA